MSQPSTAAGANTEAAVPRKYSWDAVALEQLNPALSRRIISAEQIMLAHVYLQAGCIVPKHEHVNEQLTYILQGALRFWLGDKVNSEDVADSVVVASGEVLVIPSGVPHRAIALEDTLDVDIFAPPRADWLGGYDHYLRGPVAASPAGEGVR